MENKQTIKRMPRPLGLTYLTKSLNNPNLTEEEKTEYRHRINRHIINQWIQQGNELMGKIYSIDDIAKLTNLPINQIHTIIHENIERNGTLWDDGDKALKYARALFSIFFQKGLENLNLTKAQAVLLFNEQRGQYVPFLSSATNQAIGNLMAANKSVFEQLKSVMGTATNTFIPANEGLPNESGQAYLSPTQAMKMIADKAPSILENNDLILAKEAALKGLPEVNARYQNLNNIGIRFDGSGNPNNPIPGTIDPIKKVPKTHENRRQNELDIVEDIDEFIA